MRVASFAVGLLVAAGISISVSAAPDTRSNTAIVIKKKAVQSAKPTWEQCYNMSITRGFNHEIEEWHQSIDDCMAGKIPL